MPHKVFAIIPPFWVLVMLIFALTGCAKTNVQVMEEYGGMLARPDTILVYDFTTSLEDIELDQGIGSKIAAYAKGTPKSVEERRIGRAVAEAMSEELVKKINELGMPAQRAFSRPPTGNNVLIIDGRFLDIDQGNRTQRIVIGLGMGGSQVSAHVEVYQLTSAGRKIIEEFKTIAKSTKKPGMAETMGVGAVAGHLAISAAASTGIGIASQMNKDSVTAEATRTADEIAVKLKTFFKRQGWI